MFAFCSLQAYDSALEGEELSRRIFNTKISVKAVSDQQVSQENRRLRRGHDCGQGRAWVVWPRVGRQSEPVHNPTQASTQRNAT